VKGADRVPYFLYWGFEWRKIMKNLTLCLLLVAVSFATPSFAEDTKNFDDTFSEETFSELCGDISADTRLEKLKAECSSRYTRYKGDELRSYYHEVMTNADTEIKYGSSVNTFGHCPEQVIPDGVPGPGGYLDSETSSKQKTEEVTTREGTETVITTTLCEWIASCEPCLDNEDKEVELPEMK